MSTFNDICSICFIKYCIINFWNYFSIHPRLPYTITTRNIYEIYVFKYKSKLFGFYKTLLGAPASEDGSVAATGVFAQLQEINGKIANFDYISGVTINGTDAPESEGKAQLFDFTQSNGLPGLVPVPSDVVLTAEDIYMLTAKGTWEQPRDTRIGSLTYNDTTYTTVTDYVDARVNNVTMVWSKITE